jgi:hypothetical protein
LRPPRTVVWVAAPESKIWGREEGPALVETQVDTPVVVVTWQQIVPKNYETRTSFYGGN